MFLFVILLLQNALGGGEGVEGLYGSIGRSGMAKVLASLTSRCDLGPSSCLVDIGAGLARPLLHAAIVPGVRQTVGIEVDSIKVVKAEAFVERVCARLRKKGLVSDEDAKDDCECGNAPYGAAQPASDGPRREAGTAPAALPHGTDASSTQAVRLVAPTVRCADLLELDSLPPGTTHAYSFWEGIPVDARRAFGRLAAACDTLEAMAVVQRAIRSKTPEQAMALEWCFPQLSCVDSFSVSMSGSGRSFTAYVFRVVGRGKWADETTTAAECPGKLCPKDAGAGNRVCTSEPIRYPLPVAHSSALKAIEAAACGIEPLPCLNDDDVASILTPDPGHESDRLGRYLGDDEVSCGASGLERIEKEHADAVELSLGGVSFGAAATETTCHPAMAKRTKSRSSAARSTAPTVAPRRSARLASKDPKYGSLTTLTTNEPAAIASSAEKELECAVALEEEKRDLGGSLETSPANDADTEHVSPRVPSEECLSSLCSGAPRPSIPPSSLPRKRPSPTKARAGVSRQRRAAHRTDATESDEEPTANVRSDGSRRLTCRSRLFAAATKCP